MATGEPTRALDRDCMTIAADGRLGMMVSAGATVGSAAQVLAFSILEGPETDAIAGMPVYTISGFKAAYLTAASIGVFGLMARLLVPHGRSKPLQARSRFE